MKIKGKVLIVDEEFQFDYSLKALLFSSGIGSAFVASNCLQLRAKNLPFNSFIKLYKRGTAFVQLLKSSLP